MSGIEQALRRICDPEAVDARAKADQHAKAEFWGGNVAILKEGLLVYTPPPDGWPPWHAQIDAIWVADAAGVPTLNGYSGNSPPGWGLEDPFVRGSEDRTRLDASVEAWAKRWGLAQPVCRVPASP